MRGSARTTSSTRRSPSAPRSRERSRRVGGDRLLAAYKIVRRNRAARVQGLVLTSRCKYDEDQRDNEINARRQQVQILFAKAAQASAWFDPELLSDPAADGAGVDGGERRAGGLSLRDRRAVSPAGARARRKGRAAAVACRAAFRRRRTTRYAALSTADVKHPTDRAVERRRSHADLRAVPRDPRDQPQSGRPRGGVHRVSQAVRGQRQHLRVALQRRAAARLVSRAGARLRIDARCGAARQQHPDRRGRESDRRRRRPASSRCGDITGCARRVLGLDTYHTYDTTIPLVDVDREVSVRRRARMAAGVGRAARRRLPAAAARGPRRRVDRRVREPGQAQRRLLGAGVRRAIRTCS